MATSGVITIAYGFVVLFLLPPVPEKVKWGFSQEQKEIARRRTLEAYNVEDAKINPKHILLLAVDPKIYFYGIFTMVFCENYTNNCSFHILLLEYQPSNFQYLSACHHKVFRLPHPSYSDIVSSGIFMRCGFRSTLWMGIRSF